MRDIEMFAEVFNDSMLLLLVMKIQVDRKI